MLFEFDSVSYTLESASSADVLNVDDMSRMNIFSFDPFVLST